MEVLKSELNSTSAYVPAKLTKDSLLLRHIASLTKSNIKIDNIDLPLFYSLPKTHKYPYKSRFISHSMHFSITSKVEVPSDVRNSRSVDMTSSGKNVLNILTNASPKCDRTRCQEG